MSSPVNQTDLRIVPSLSIDVGCHIISYLDSKTKTAFCQAMAERTEDGIRVPTELINAVLLTTGQEIRFFLQTIITKLRKLMRLPEDSLIALLKSIDILEKILSNLNHLPTGKFPNLRTLKRDYLCRVKADILAVLAIQHFSGTLHGLKSFGALLNSCPPPSCFKNIFDIYCQIVNTRGQCNSGNNTPFKNCCQELTAQGEFHTTIRILKEPYTFVFLPDVADGFIHMEEDLPLLEMIHLIRSSAEETLITAPFFINENTLLSQSLLSALTVAFVKQGSSDKALEVLQRIESHDIFQQTLREISTYFRNKGDVKNATEWANQDESLHIARLFTDLETY